MKNTTIRKIRQLLVKAKKDVRSLTPAGICYPLYGEKSVEETIDKALALLPCETCGGSKTYPIRPASADGLTPEEPCPDCKPRRHKPGCASFNNPPHGFASSVSECDCKF
ncbi:unnamed protein product [marine sediment metagenome]|uniref:Uncharacterized protein n=1 Tax=marine sediment metagenome TaxID=412755 RepID=X1L481_9ZZZZ